MKLSGQSRAVVIGTAAGMLLVPVLILIGRATAQCPDRKCPLPGCDPWRPGQCGVAQRTVNLVPCACPNPSCDCSQFGCLRFRVPIKKRPGYKVCLSICLECGWTVVQTRRCRCPDPPPPPDCPPPGCKENRRGQK